jgi:phage virion morphogenesis protein
MSAGIAIDVATIGLDNLQTGLQRMAALGERPRPIWDALGQYGESSTRLRFPRQQDPDKKRWVPSIRARVSGGQTLVHKARLMRSITHNASNSGTSWGTNVIYAGVHNDGKTIKAKSGALRFRIPGGGFATVKAVKMPQRAFIGINADDAKEINYLVIDAVHMAARNQGAGNVGPA